MLIFRIIFYLLSFIIIWLASGLVVSAVDKFTKLLKISAFAFSFFVLGILTSLPEIAVGTNSIIEKTPQIFIGNLIGGVIVIFLFIIPFYAFLGNGIKLNHQLSGKNLLLILIVSIAPAFLIADKRITTYEGIFLIILYLLVFYFIEKKQHLIEAIEDKFAKQEVEIFKNLFQILVGVIIIFFSSRYLVEQTIFFADLLKISPFVISLLVLAMGTNLPELSVGLRSILSGKKEIALGDYLGSAAANCLIFGSLTVLFRTILTIASKLLMNLQMNCNIFLRYLYPIKVHIRRYPHSTTGL